MYRRGASSSEMASARIADLALHPAAGRAGIRHQGQAWRGRLDGDDLARAGVQAYFIQENVYVVVDPRTKIVCPSVGAFCPR